VVFAGDIATNEEDGEATVIFLPNFNEADVFISLI
jgi:hypothetical protein